jgi:thiamine phosphate synthase YjbQ (UPF0047 family)
MRTASIIRAIIALTMEAIRTDETSVNFHETTRRYIPERCHLNARRRENLNSHIDNYMVIHSQALIVEDRPLASIFRIS